MSEGEAPPPLRKHKSWPPSIYRDREESWARRQGNHLRRHKSGGGRRSNSVTDDDLDELRGCIDLGFGFDLDSNNLDPKLSETFPALELFCAVNRNYSECVSRSSSMSNLTSDSDTTPLGSSPSTNSLFDLGDDPKTVKNRLKQWAQVVACTIRQSSRIP